MLSACVSAKIGGTTGGRGPISEKPAKALDQRLHVRWLDVRPHSEGRAGQLDQLHGRDCQAQAEATKDAQRAGIAHATSEQKYRGRKPSFSRNQFNQVVVLVNQGTTSVSQIAKAAEAPHALSCAGPTSTPPCVQGETLVRFVIGCSFVAD
jgi:hypothetical protein